MPDEFALPPAWAFGSTDVINLGPRIDPPFSDAQDYSQYLTSVETRPVYVEQREPSVTDQSAQEAVDVALASEQVIRELEGKRYEVLGVGSKSADRQTDHPLVVIYNYANDVVIEATVDLGAGAALEVNVQRYQPSLSVSELGYALDLVRQDGRLTEAGIDIDTGTGLVVEEMNFRDPCFGHRLVDLRFGPAHRRVPVAFAIVDLTNRDVIKTGLLPEEAPS
jgi:hypothetical protein